MTFLKNHWFGFILSLFVFAFVVVFVLVMISPRQDLQKRGFIPCTEILADELFACEKNKAVCMVKAILKNTWCDTKVIGEGAKLWADGKQKTPWENYLFTPELEDPEELDEGLEEFYEQTPDVEASMNNLKKLNLELEKQIKEEQDQKEINDDKQEE